MHCSCFWCFSYPLPCSMGYLVCESVAMMPERLSCFCINPYASAVMRTPTLLSASLHIGPQATITWCCLPVCLAGNGHAEAYSGSHV